MPRGRPRTKPARTTQVRKYTRRGTEKIIILKLVLRKEKQMLK